MVPDKFNMVDMGGIDLIMMQGEEVPGLYMRLVESIARCRYQCLYNWLFDGVVIPPTYIELRIGDEDEVVINEGITVTDDDVIHIYSIERPPEIIPLLAEENGVYNAPVGKDGFNPVTVDVPSYTPVINPITITENGTYTAPSGVDGYGPVVVNVPSSGVEVITGTTDPIDSQGNNGDIYFKTVSTTLDKLEYIENTSNAWIQTGYVPKSNSKFELDGIFPAPSNSYDTPFGTRYGIDNFVAYNGGMYRYVFGNSSGNVGDMSSYYNQDATMVLSSSECSLVVNGITVLQSIFSASGLSGVGMGLFTLATGSTSRMDACNAKFKLKEFRIYEDDVIVHQYIPSESDNIAGLTDIITSTFLGPTSGSFVSGPQQGVITVTTVISVYYKVNGTWKQIPGII